MRYKCILPAAAEVLLAVVDQMGLEKGQKCAVAAESLEPALEMSCWEVVLLLLTS